MIHFNEEAVKYGVSMCKSKPHYKVCVAVTQARRAEAFEAIYSAIDGENCDVRKNSVYIQAVFPNGSYIRTIPATANSRGYRAHLMIIDDLADREVVEYVLRPHEFLENIDMHREEIAKQVDIAKEFSITYRDDSDVADISPEDFLKIIGCD